MSDTNRGGNGGDCGELESRCPIQKGKPLLRSSHYCQTIIPGRQDFQEKFEIQIQLKKDNANKYCKSKQNM